MGNCYAVMAVVPPGHPAWRGRSDGAVMQCVADPGLPAGTKNLMFFWVPTVPDEVAPPSPAEIAWEVAVSMRLHTGAIGTAPAHAGMSDYGHDPVVGAPMWLWIVPAENTTGPMTRTNTGYGVTVTVTATLDRVDWELRSRTAHAGAHVVARTTCAGTDAPGTVYSASLNPRDAVIASPTCGWDDGRIATTGTYSLTARATWNVTWQGPGQTGSFTITPPGQTVPVTIGEAQAIETAPHTPHDG